MTLNQSAWKLKHQLIVQSIKKHGDYDIEKINLEVYDRLKIDSYEVPEENQSNDRVVDALRKVLK